MHEVLYFKSSMIQKVVPQLASKTGLNQIFSNQGNNKDFEFDIGNSMGSFRSEIVAENKSIVEKVGSNDIEKGKGKGKYGGGGEGEMKFSSLRSGKKIQRRMVEQGTLSEELLNYCDSDQSLSVKRRRFSREKKGKCAVFEQGVSVLHFMKLELEVKIKTSPVHQSLYTPVLSNQDDEQAATMQNGESTTRRRYNREDKGKNVMADDNLPHSVDMLEGKSKHEVGKSIDVTISRAINFSEDRTIYDGVQVMDTNVSVTAGRRGYKERFRDIARRNAFRFAHFSFQAEHDVDVSNEAVEEIPLEEVDAEEIEEWPGPFATAMKIIRDRQTNIKHQHHSSSLEISKIGPATCIGFQKGPALAI